MKSFKNRLYFRILFYFLTLLVPLLALSTVFYFNYTKMIERDFSEKIALNLQASAQTVDLYLRTVHESSLNLLNSDTMQRLLMPEKWYSLNERAELARIPSNISRTRSIVSDFTDQLFVFIDDRKVYTSSGAEDADLFFRKLYHFTSYPKSFWMARLAQGRSFEILFPTFMESSRGNNGKVIPFVTIQTVNGHKAASVTTIPIGRIEKAFTNNSIFSSTAFIILNSHNEVVFHNYPTDITDEIRNQLVHIPGKALDRIGKDTIDGSKAVITHIDSDNYGWKYYSITPLSALNEKTTGALDIILICTIALCTGIFFSIMFSVKIYNPIKKIREILEEQSFEENTAIRTKNGFAYIGEGVAKLSQNKEDFKNKFKRLKSEYMDDFFINILDGTYSNSDLLMKHEIAKEIGFTESGYLICNFQFHFNHDFYAEFQDVDRFVILNKLKNVLSGLLGEYVHAYVVEYCQYLYACIVNASEHEHKRVLDKALHHVLRTFRFDFQYCEICVGIGNWHAELTQLSQSFNEAMTAIGKKSPGQQFQMIDSAEMDIEDNFYYSFVDENRLINSFKAGDLNRVNSTVHEIVDFNQKKGISHRFISMLINELYHTGYNYVVEKGLPIQSFIEEEQQSILQGRMDSTMPLDLKLPRLTDFFAKIVERTAIPKDENGHSLVSMISSYIEENYDEDLYLEKIAEDLKASSKYVSRVFKEKTGTNLMDYISQIRIAEAKKLLIYTDLSINEIALKVGIFSRTTFLRHFKKLEGISPLEFRKMNRRALK